MKGKGRGREGRREEGTEGEREEGRGGRKGEKGGGKVGGVKTWLKQPGGRDRGHSNGEENKGTMKKEKGFYLLKIITTTQYLTKNNHDNSNHTHHKNTFIKPTETKNKTRKKHGNTGS